jgi:predicted dehydrogenase
MRAVRVGIIGGGSIAKAHVIGLRSLPSYFGAEGLRVEIPVIADIRRTAAENSAQRYEIDRWVTDWRAVIEDDDIDAVTIATPNHTHAEIAIAALEARKHVLCEKPLADNAGAGESMVDAAQSAGVVDSVHLNYRKIPAIQYAKRLIEAGELGSVLRYRGAFLQDWAANPLVPRSWKFEAGRAGAGPVLAVGCHVVDLARFLVGEISEVSAITKTSIRERPTPRGLSTYEVETDVSEMAPVDTDDMAAMILNFDNGAIGTIETSRVTLGRKNHCFIEINGTQGSIVFDYERMNEIHVATSQTAGLGMARVVIGPEHDGGLVWSLGGLGVGFAETVILHMRSFVKSITTGDVEVATFLDGLRAQEVVQAALASAASGVRELVPRHPIATVPIP